MVSKMDLLASKTDVAGESNVSAGPTIKSLKIDGQTSLQLVVPLILLMLFLGVFALLMPMLSTVQTLAVTAGMVVFIVCFASTEIALYILVFSMLLSPEVVVGTTGGATMGRAMTLRLDDFLIVVIGVSWLAKMSIRKDLGLFLKTPLNKPIAYYSLVCLISTLIGAMYGRADLKTGFLYVLKYFEYMVIYFMVANHLESKKQVRTYLWAMLITCAIVSIMAIAEIPGGERVSAPFEGEKGEPNTFGGYLVFMISVVTGLAVTSKSSRAQVLYGFLALVFAVPLLYTQSRSSYLAVIPAMLVFVWLSEKRLWVILAVLVAGIGFTLFTPDPAEERVTYTLNQGRYQKDVVELGGMRLDTSLSARLRNYRSVSEDWVKHPVLGYGVTGYAFVDGQYFRVIAETGLLGLITFLILISAIFRLAKGVLKEASDPFHRGLAMGFLAGFVGLLCHGIGANTFIIVRIMEPFWFVTAMVIMIPEIEKAEKQDHPSP